MTQMVKAVLLVFIMITSCTRPSQDNSIEKWKNEIMETEHNFSEMAKTEGIPKAFLTYAADDAVLMRNNNLIIGKVAIKAGFDAQEQKNASLSWTPEFVDVSASGDLGYTYGHFVFSKTDPSGKTTELKGVFHTVWKKQPNGKWLFVWD